MLRGSWWALVLALLTGCAHTQEEHGTLPPPAQSTVIGPGDVFEVTVLGEKDLEKEYRVQPDGTIDFPYLDRVKVEGLEPQQIEDLLKAELSTRKILVDPQVTLVVKTYDSKKVSVIGAVMKPGSLTWNEGMKLIDAISQAGGLTALADGDHVLVTRIVALDRTATVTVSVDDISDGRAQDVLLQAGDTVKVGQRVF